MRRKTFMRRVTWGYHLPACPPHAATNSAPAPGSCSALSPARCRNLGTHTHAFSRLQDLLLVADSALGLASLALNAVAVWVSAAGCWGRG